jgi:hypothetical protein
MPRICFPASHWIIGGREANPGARMPDMIFIALTLAVFALLGMVVKAVERL